MEIDVRTSLDSTTFRNEYLVTRRPVILTDAAAQWPAMSKWTPKYLKETIGNTSVDLDGVTRKVGEYIDLMLESNEQSPAPYLRNQNIDAIFPEIADDVRPLPNHFEPNWLKGNFFPRRLNDLMSENSAVELYVGGPGARFPVIHFDSFYTHAFLTQVYGKKELYLWAPDQTPYLYATRRNNVSSVNDVLNPDLDQFPLYAQADRGTLVLEPGQTLFIPSGWWHTARILTPSITVSVNTANASNWRDLSRDLVQQMNPVVRVAFVNYMALLGVFKNLAGSGDC